ncbi:MAG: aminotransferase class I/II-fold pyridoxal phosphate-dependent enzyme [Flavobacteriales bacterium]|nr:aminotransferase class I/II-fold pyridoxal phosphate-dependent enzyme [Flavobacteriales bacterium]
MEGKPHSKLPDLGTTIFTEMTALANRHGALNLAQGFPDLPPPEGLVDAAVRALRGGVHQYAPMAGRPDLRDWICGHHQNRHGHLYSSENECTIGAGASSLLFAAIQAFVHSGDQVVVQSPAYDLYGPAVQLAGGHLREVPLLDASGEWNLDALLEACTPAVRMVILNTPHNPTGTACPAGFLEALAAHLEGTDTLVLSDEVYGPIVHDGRPEISLAACAGLRDRGLAFGSFGKLLQVTGWKIGWAVGPAALTAELRKVHQYDVFSTGAPLQAALAEFLPTDDGAQHLAGLAAMYQAKRDRLLDGLRRTAWQCTPAEGGFFQVLDASQLIDGDDGRWAREWTHTHGIATIPLSAFYAPPIPQVRLCFAKEDATLDAAVERLRHIASDHAG